MTNHVKIQGVVPRIQYVADGTLATYEFPFAIFSADDIEVYLNDTKQTGTAYTVSGIRETDGGSITFDTAPENNTVITIVRNLSIERTSDFQEGGTLRADTLNDELDYQIACQQQIADQLNRSMVLPPYAINNDVDFTLPFPDQGKAIVWSADGKKLENSTVQVNALESTLNGYKTAAETAATTASTQAGIASDKADLATEKAQLASDKADIATSKAAEVSEALSTKANLNLNNVASNLDYIIESSGPNSNGMWYRIYKSGWCEQGGRCSTTSITFLKAMENTAYQFVHNTAENTNWCISHYTKNTTGITSIKRSAYGTNDANNDKPFDWIVSGFKQT